MMLCLLPPGDPIVVRTSESAVLLVPKDLDCLLPCGEELEKIKNSFVEDETCDDLIPQDRTFYNCYIR